MEIYYRIFIFQFFCLLLTLSGRASSAADNVLVGQYIVEVQSDKAFNQLVMNLRLDARFSDLSVEKLMDAPFNLWLLKTNPYNEHIPMLEKSLKAHKSVYRCLKNKRLQEREMPNDPLFPNQWQLENVGQNNGLPGADLDIISAWNITTGGLTYSGDTIVVAVLDDGVNGRHPDMAANMYVNSHEVPHNDIDDDGNGYVDDYYGWNVKFNNDDVYSGGGHGTPVAGIIGAVGNNEVGVSGVNWKIKILPVDYGEASEARALASYGYVYKMRQLWNETKGEKGAFIAVTNASWGIDQIFADEAPLWCALYDALGQIGILNVGATSNSNVDVDEVGDMPSTCESEYLIIATNVNRQDVRHGGGSAYGRKSVDIGAFGHQVYTTTRNSYGTFGGTSGAAPHVAGLAALMYSAPCAVLDSLIHSNPALSVLVIKDMLLLGADSNVSLENITATGGRINAFRALSNIMTICEGCSPPAGVVLNATDSSVIIQWPFDAGGPISLRYRKSYELAWNLIDNIDNGYELKALDFCEEYEIQWSAICGFLPKEYGYSKFFKTAGCCQLPEIKQVDIFEESIKIQLNHEDEAVYKWTYSLNNGEIWDTIVSGKGFEWSNLGECQTIQFSVQSLCLKHNNVSVNSPHYIYSTSCGACTENTYCQFGSKTNSQEWIKSFEIGDFINFSEKEPNGYTHFLGLNSIQLAQGQNYPIKVGIGYISDSYSEYLRIYIDFDQDGIYGPEEEVFNQGPQIDSFIGEISIPESAFTGYTGMRVILTYDEFEGACDSSLFEFGEVEDYCVFIGEPCIGQFEWDTLAKTTTSLTFKVKSRTENIDSLKLYIRAKGEQEWDSYYIVDSLLIFDLKPCKVYEYQVYSVCGTVVSKGSSIDTVKTLCTNSIENIQGPIHIYPNPAHDFLFIETGNSLIDKSRLDIRSIDGRSREVSFLKPQNGSVGQIDVSSLESGLYILLFDNGNGEVTPHKIIVIREGQ